MSSCFRIKLPADNKRRSRDLIVKLSSEDETSRQTGIQQRIYLREVCFYRDIKSLVTIPTPDCYFADCEPDGANFALLLEDLSPAVQGDQMSGCSLSLAASAVFALVGLHAPTWRNTQLREHPVLAVASVDESNENYRQLFKQLLPAFLDRYNDQLNDSEKQAFVDVAEAESFPIGRATTERHCLVHGDYRLDNLLIEEKTEPAKTSTAIHVVDWQTISIGNPMIDVAFFLGGSCHPEDRRQSERQIVSGYHSRMQAAGVVEYNWEDCWQDYRLSSYHGFGTAVLASMLAERTSRGDELFLTMARRHAQHAIDLEAAELLN